MAATPRQLATYVGAFAAFVAAIHVVPGPWRKWSRGQYVDNWTWTHLLWGYIGERMHQNFGQQMTFAAANELFEVMIRRYRPEWLWAEPEDAGNIASDLAANAAGWAVGRTTRA